MSSECETPPCHDVQKEAYATPTSFFVILYSLNYGVPVEKDPDAAEKGAFKTSESASGGKKVASKSMILAADGEKVVLQSSVQASSGKKVASASMILAADGEKVALRSSEQALGA